MSAKFSPLVILALVYLALFDTGLCRTFTNTKGQKIKADILSVDDQKVTLKLSKNNKVYTLNVDKLSSTDQDYIRDWKKQKEAENNNNEEPSDAADSKDKARKSSNRSRHPLAQFYYKTIKEEHKLSDNFSAEWPKISSTDIPEIVVIKEDPEKNEFIYESPNYQFVCDVRLSKNVVKKFSHLFEATRDYCKALPISMMKAQLPDGKIKYKILLFESRNDYLKNGGLEGSAGVYYPMKDLILVPLTSLGVKKVGSGYMYDYDGSNKTLPHEIAHQLTNLEYYNQGALGWFSEGLAEYIAITDYRSGKFMIRNNIKEIKEYTTGFSKKTRKGRNIGEEFTAPDLKEFMNMSYDNFTENANFNYAFGCLITYYFFHMDQQEDRANINAFLKALNEGKEGDAAIDYLLNGRTFEQLEEDIAKAWKSKGVKIQFN